MAVETVGLGLILFVAFVPPLVYMVRIRNVERFNRNPITRMLLLFEWGAIGAVVLAVLLESRLNVPFDALRPSAIPAELWLAVLLAPFCEEPVKVAGLYLVRRKHLLEEEDGLVYGAAAGLGFAATENLLYEVVALQSFGFEGWVATAVMRTLTSTLLHGSSSAIAGWGVAKARRGPGQGGAVFKHLAGAMVLHGSFNLCASLALLSTGELPATVLSLLLVFVVSGAAYRFVRAKIRELDRQSLRPQAAGAGGR